MTQQQAHTLIKDLLTEKKLYENDISNAFLQEKELGIIAEQIISISKTLLPEEMTAEEKDAVRWADNFLTYR